MTFPNSSSVRSSSLSISSRNIWRICHCCRSSEVDRALGNCQNVLGHWRGLGLPVAFIPVTHLPAARRTTCRRTTSIARFRKHRNTTETCMKRRTGSPSLYLASSVTEKTLAANSEDRLHSVLATLEQCRTALTKDARPETAKLVSLAILQLRMELHQVTDLELKALCDALMPADVSLNTLHDPKSSPRPAPEVLRPR